MRRQWIPATEPPKEAERVLFYSVVTDYIHAGSRIIGVWYDDERLGADGTSLEVDGVVGWMRMPGKPQNGELPGL